MDLLYNEETTVGRLASYFSKYFPQLTERTRRLLLWLLIAMLALGDLREHAFAACIARERNYADKRVSWVKERAGEKEDEFVMEENVIPF